MAYYKAVEGFEFHEKVTIGNYDYYIYMNKHSQILIRKMHTITESTRYCLTIDNLASVIASPETYNFQNIDYWEL